MQSVSNVVFFIFYCLPSDNNELLLFVLFVLTNNSQRENGGVELGNRKCSTNRAVCVIHVLGLHSTKDSILIDIKPIWQKRLVELSAYALTDWYYGYWA